MTSASLYYYYFFFALAKEGGEVGGRADDLKIDMITP